MGHPMRLFHFFWPWCGRWKVVAAISSKKSGTISFFFIIFWPFLPIFPFFGFLAHFAHFMPPYGRPLITCDPISYFRVSWVQLAHGWHCRQKKSMNFGFLKKNDHFSIFGHFDPWQPPIGRRTKHWGTSGAHLRVPTPPSWLYTVAKLAAPYTFLTRGSIWYTPLKYASENWWYFTQTKIASKRNKLESCATSQMKAGKKGFKTFF